MCEFRIQVLNMILLRLICKTQCWETNLRVGQSWVPNTFPRTYLNSKLISLVVRSMVLPWEVAIYMVLRPLQKLRGNSNIFCCVHNGNSTSDNEFNSYVFYFLTLIKTFSILVCTHITWFLLSLNLGWWWVGRWKAPFGPKSSRVHPTNSQSMSSPIMDFK